jgi:Uma2 family endonuclease
MTTRAQRHVYENFGEVLERLGNVSPHRVRLTPKPGTATEKDVVRIQDHTNRCFELVDGILVEKAVGSPESFLTCDFIVFLGVFLQAHPLGFLAGPDGIMRLWPGRLRMPDISFISWDQLPKRERPTEAITGLAPALAVEVLSDSNTREEMELKRREYFLAGTRLVWMVDPPRRVVEVYTAPDQFVTLSEEQTLDGGDVLPGFALPLRKLFANVAVTPAGPGRNKPARPATQKRRKS